MDVNGWMGLRKASINSVAPMRGAEPTTTVSFLVLLRIDTR